ncbi:MAG: ComEC/Rec2 family competence protein [Rhodococcus sp. (in: high G+C Gram-positive bacteria)]|uniref:ComEC/Rec2 family competence protein n=1 Tax=Rhodococcus sp. TaxID=1831 RepID=UPI003BAE95C8
MPEGDLRVLDLRLVPFAVVSWSSATTAILLGSRAAWWLVAGFAGGAVAVVIVRVLRSSIRGPATGGLVALALFGSCCAGAVALRVQAVEEHPLTVLGRDGAWATLTVALADDPRTLATFGNQVIVKANVVEIRTSTETVEARGAVVVLAPADGWLGLLPGQRAVLRGQLSSPRHRDLTLATVRVSGPPHVVEPAPVHQDWAGALRARFASAASALPPDQAGLLPGLVLGDTSRLSSDVKDDFTATGLTHLTAVSGANVSIILGAVLLLVRAVGVGPRTGAVLAAIALSAFVVVARPSPSVVRAAVMGAVALLALVAGRRKQALPALSTAVIVLLAWHPALAVDFGFVLSAAATAGLIVIAPVWVDALVRRGWPRGVAEMFSVSAAAFAVTAPVVAGMTGTVSVVSVCANILVAPVVGVITVLGAITAVVAAVSVQVAAVSVLLTEGPLWWLITVAERGAQVPGASIPVPSGPTGAVLVLGVLVIGGLMVRGRRLRLVSAGIVLGLLVVWAPVWPAVLLGVV